MDFDDMHTSDDFDGAGDLIRWGIIPKDLAPGLQSLACEFAKFCSKSEEQPME